MSFYKTAADSEPMGHLKKRAREIGALPPRNNNSDRSREPILISAINQAFELETDSGGGVVYDSRTNKPHVIKPTEITGDEALAVALVLHIRYWKSRGFKMPIKEEEVIERLKVDPIRVSKIIKGKKAEFFSFRF